MKSFSQLKKDLQKGKRLKVLYHATRPEQQNNIKTITRTQTNGIYTTCENDRNSKEIWLELPNAALVEYNNNIFTIYEQGQRELNEQEKNFLEQAKNEIEKNPFCNSYFIKLALAKKMGLPYMVESTKNKRFYNNKIFTNEIKGEKFISFEILEG